MERRRYLVAYDIRSEPRLRQVHKTMCGFGEPLQYSVFLCDLDDKEKFAMKRELGKVINHGVDSIAIVDLGESKRRGSECFEFMGVGGYLPTDEPRIV